jgi:hypothetical protein
MDELALHKCLDLLLPLRRACLRDGASGEAVQDFLRLALLFVRDLMTEPVFARAMKSAEQGEGLLRLANRVQMLAPIIGDNWPADFTFDDVVNDLFAIANGDAPRVLKSDGKQGRFHNAHALVEAKLDAHGWYKVLGLLKMKAADRQSLIIASYSITLDAFKKWRREAKSKLTGEYVDRYLVTFCDTQMFAAALEPDRVAWAIAQTKAAGGKYRAELRR